MKIAVLDDYAQVSASLADWTQIKDADISVFSNTIDDEQQLIERLLPFDVICIMRERTPFPSSLINQLPNLKLLVTSGPRNLSIDLEAAKTNNITVCSTESRKTTTSELTLLLMLSLSRELVSEVNALRTQGWQSSLGRDLHGQHLGLIGLGKIGLQVATLAKAFGMHVHAWSPNLTEQKCQQNEVTFAPSLNSLMSSADIVSVHMVLSERSRSLVNAEAFSAMRDRAIFINTSRGPIADEAALLAGLKAGKPWKAGLDVFNEEPLPKNDPLRNNELMDSGRLLLSPHLGYSTEQTFKIFYEQTVEAVVAWQQGKPIRVLT